MRLIPQLGRLSSRIWEFGAALPAEADERGAQPGAAPRTRRAPVLRTAAVLAVLSVPAVLARDLVGRVAGMHALAETARPYLVLEHALLLYIATPLVVASACLFFLAPGLLWILALRQARRWTEAVPLGFGASLVILVVTTTAIKLVLGPPLTAAQLLGLWIGSGVAAVAFERWSLGRGTDAASPGPGEGDRLRLLWLAAIPTGVVITLLPKLFWENFNEDGVEAFEFGRSLISGLWPSWNIQGGVFGLYHNYVLFAYPNSWFTILFGSVEAAARLPFALYLAVLLFALLAIIEWRTERPLRAAEQAVLALGLACFATVIAFNGSYDPFFADIAEPGAPDTLIVICVAMAGYSFLAQRDAWFWVFGLLSFLAGPNGLMVLALVGAATAIWWSSPTGRVRLLARFVVVCAAIGVLYEFVYNPLVLGGIESQYSVKSLLRRLLPPSFGHAERFNLLVFPSGILPALALLFWRWQDAVARTWATVVIGYFVILYPQSWTSLHQFTPILVLPLVVFWRVYLRRGQAWQRLSLPALAGTTAVALFLSLPRHFEINVENRALGSVTSYRVGDYETDYRGAFRSADVLYEVMPHPDVWKLGGEDPPWGVDAYVWLYYASRPESHDGNGDPAYIVQPMAEPAPDGFELVSETRGLSVYVGDRKRWRLDRERFVRRDYMSPLYEPVFRETFDFFRAYMEAYREDEGGNGA